MKNYLKVLRKYSVFKGRASRNEYWEFALINIIIIFFIGILEGAMGSEDSSSLPIGGIIYWLFTLFVFIPSIAVGVRRLHDTNRSGWMLLILLIPIIGTFWILVLTLLKGNESENKYGAVPEN